MTFIVTHGNYKLTCDGRESQVMHGHSSWEEHLILYSLSYLQVQVQQSRKAHGDTSTGDKRDSSSIGKGRKKYYGP